MSDVSLEQLGEANSQCANNEILGTETHLGEPFTSTDDCAKYIVNFGMPYRGCDGVYYSYNDATSECACSLWENCQYDGYVFFKGLAVKQ